MKNQLRRWTHKQDQDGVETAKTYEKKLSGRAGGPFKRCDAAN